MINIKDTFIKLTTKRYPHGKEDEVIELLPDYDFNKDDVGNYYIIVPKEDGSFSNTMFASHIDTVDRGSYSNRRWDVDLKKYVYENGKDDRSVKHVIKDDFIKTDGNTNLGADDKAGVVILLNMITEKIPGLYYFFIGEESGCIGSSSLSRLYEDLVEKGTLPKVNKCVSFDRKGYDSVITHQMSGRSASDKFADELSNRFNEYGFWYKSDSSGVYTDSAEFTDVIEECTNISVGYFSEHTSSEKQDIEFLELLAVVSTKIDWETLPIDRKVDEVYKGKKSKSKGRSNYYNNRYAYGDDYWDDDYGYGVYPGYNTTPSQSSSTSTSSSTKGSGMNQEPNDKHKVDYDMDEFDSWYNKQRQIGWTVDGKEED